MPTRPSRRARNPLVIVGNAIFTLLILVLVVGGGAVVVGKSRFEAPGPLQEDKVVTIPPRSGMMDIADLLQREGVIDEHRLIFAGGVLALKARGELKAGEYLFQKHASVRDVVETIVEGKVVQHQLTIPEGLTSEQIVARLLENDMLTGNIKDVPREGSLLPDSYHFHRGFSREQTDPAHAPGAGPADARGLGAPQSRSAGAHARAASHSRVDHREGNRQARGAHARRGRVRQPAQAEDEAAVRSDHRLRSGVRQGLARPSDQRADIQSQTPYNTYVIDGLPPGPIANPGRASIEAAANPARTKELFFVADGTGGHAFAETYDQHQKNVAKLRAIEQEARGERPEAAPPPAEAQPHDAAARAPPAARRRGPSGPHRAPGTPGTTPRSAGAQ